MHDFIFSEKTGETYAKVQIFPVQDSEYHYKGRIVEDGFPDELSSLIKEYDSIVRECSLTLIDEVEEKIYGYQLRLKFSGSKIFNLLIQEDKTIDFWTKYPAAKGFRDEYFDV